MSVSRASWLPFALLLGYGVAFAARGLGVAPLAFDDHPGQLARLQHVLREGPAPWAWSDGWWAGYPELQFYPPGWFYVGAALSWATLGALAPASVYQALLWLTYLAPGVTAFLLLRRLVGAWAALPGACVVLAFAGDPAGGTASGVEGGVRIGMVGARLAWALLPLLALALAQWTERGGRVPPAAIAILAATMLTHPTHVPAALAILAGAVLSSPVRRRAMRSAVGAILVALGLAAFWLAPLLWRLDETRALAWGSLTTSSLISPFTAALIGLALTATSRATSVCRMALHAVWLSALAVAVDALVAEPLGVRFLPADRVADGAWMSMLIASGIGAGVIVHAAGRRVPVAAAALAVTAALIAFSLPGQALMLWPRATDWPTQASVSQGLRLEDLWRTLRAAPPGRVLFVRSGVPLVHGTAWYRPHTHVTALTPVLAGRDILGGTFTHGSPVASLVYRGDTRRAPITRLAEQLDGESLFGRPLDALAAATFEAHAARFRVAAVVALEDDAPRLPFVNDNPRYRRVIAPPFLVFVAAEAPLAPPYRLDNVRDVEVRAGPDGWASTGLAYYPLWRAEHTGQALPTRRGLHGDLEVKVPTGTTGVRLTYGPGLIELAASGASAIVLVGVAADAWMTRRRVRSALDEVPAGRHAERGPDRVGRIEDPHMQR